MDFAASILKAHESVPPAVLSQRLLGLWERTGDAALHRLGERKHPQSGEALTSELDLLDWVSTCLMDSYRNTGDAQVFALLYELNEPSFLQTIQGKLRRAQSHLDAQDVMQEVFLNIYRYPHKFHAERGDSFRNWGHRILRNALLKALKGQVRFSRWASLDDEQMLDQADVHARSPEQSAAEAESAHLVDQAYLIYLNLYWLHFQQLSEKERRALQMVEVEGVSYKAAADALGIRLENLKMVVFRGRKKIFRGLVRSLADLGQEPVPHEVARRVPAADRSAGGTR